MLVGIEQRRVRFSVACAAMGLAALAVGAAPAAAHPDTRAEAERLCGSGYAVVKDPDGTPARRAVKTGSGAVYGHVYLTYDNANGRNCVVTIKSRFHNRRTYTTAGLQVRGKSGPCDGWYCDFGNFAHFAGGPPDYKTTVYAAGSCVRYWAHITSGRDGQGTLAQGGRLRWWNCGG